MIHEFIFMKKIEKDKARLLRTKGQSINEIARSLGVTKSSVSAWVRDIELTTLQKKKLSEHGRSVESIEKRRLVRLANERARRDVFFQAAINEVKGVRKNELFFLGVSLYWGEGAKTSRGTVEFTNSDPRAVQVMMRFFREVCLVPKDKFRGHVILHPHLDSERSEQHWSQVSGIPRSQFQKTSMQHNKASKNKKDSLPMGTFSIGIYDTLLYLKLMGWMEGIYKNLVNKKRYLPCKYHVFL